MVITVKAEFIDALSTMVDRIKYDEPLYKHTTFKVGGPAKVLVSPSNIQELVHVLRFVKEHHIPYFVLGRGSNVLVSDQMFDGVVIEFRNHFDDVHVNGCIVRVQAGKSLIQLSYELVQAGLSGFEFASGIPGTIGGAMFMNAGAYNRSMSDVVKSVVILDENLEERILLIEELQTSYRSTIFQQRRDWIILGVELELEPADPETIQKLIDERKERRVIAQPWSQPCAGSVFRNPGNGQYAWQFIESLGLRGHQIGGAQISLKHANFIVNTGYASAKDVYELIVLVQASVYREYGFKFETEIELVNWESN